MQENWRIAKTDEGRSEPIVGGGKRPVAKSEAQVNVRTPLDANVPLGLRRRETPRKTSQSSAPSTPRYQARVSTDTGRETNGAQGQTKTRLGLGNAIDRRYQTRAALDGRAL